jgi:hypothetical protein
MPSENMLLVCKVANQLVGETNVKVYAAEAMRVGNLAAELEKACRLGMCSEARISAILKRISELSDWKSMAGLSST